MKRSRIYDKLLNYSNINFFKSSIIGLDKDKYFDYTASGLAYKTIEQRIMKVLETYANTHSESKHAQLTHQYYEEARDVIRESLDIDDSFCVLPSGTGATSAIRHFQKIMGIYLPPRTRERVKVIKKSTPLVIVGPYEHHSNEVSYREALCDVIRIGTKNGRVDLEELEIVLKKNKNREIISSFCVASNVTGIVTPYKEISKLVREYNGVVCFDAAASSPYMNIDSEYYDALVMSPHKLVGGPGASGLLIISKELAGTCNKPTFAGGGTVEYVNSSYQIYSDDIETREDSGTPGIIQFIRTALSYQLRNEIGLEYIRNEKDKLTQHFLSELKKIPNIDIYSPDDSIGIISFNIKNNNPHDISVELSNKFNINVRAGCSCAGPYGHELLGLDESIDMGTRPGWIRVSIHYSHTKKELDYLIQSIKQVIRR